MATRACKDLKDVYTIDDIGLTQKQKEALVKLARSTADNLGYCGETDGVLTEVGLLPPPEFEVTITLKVKNIESGVSAQDAKWELERTSNWNIENYGVDMEILEVKSAVAKEIK